jgi:hypothetical protein
VPEIEEYDEPDEIELELNGVEDDDVFTDGDVELED